MIELVGPQDFTKGGGWTKTTALYCLVAQTLGQRLKVKQIWKNSLTRFNKSSVLLVLIIKIKKNPAENISILKITVIVWLTKAKQDPEQLLPVTLY